MLGMDEPIHGRLRSLVQKAFTQKSLARWEDELVGRVGNSLIDKFAANGKADLVKEFTFDYPSRIIAGLLGLPEEDYPQFQRWSISLLSWIMNPERGLAASAALCDYFAPILAAILAPILAFVAPIAAILAPAVVLRVGERSTGRREQRSPQHRREQEPRQLYAHSLPPTDFRRI